MRLYLSSFRMGNHPEHLAALVGGDGRNVVVIANALDDAPADVRRSGVEGELAALADLGQLPAPARRPGSPHQWPRHQDRVVPPSAWARLFKDPDGPAGLTERARMTLAARSGPGSARRHESPTASGALSLPRRNAGDLITRT